MLEASTTGACTRATSREEDGEEISNEKVVVIR
jgi:hypothetical protein